jgi:hypothetical protein
MRNGDLFIGGIVGVLDLRGRHPFFGGIGDLHGV